MMTWQKKVGVMSLLGLVLQLMNVSHASGEICPVNPKDPYERFNRVMYNFNDFLDQFILMPVAKFYNHVMPKPLNKAVTNFFSNVDTVPTFANDILQANFYQAANDGWRLAINTTVGIVGFFDVATPIGLEPNTEDLGLTFARWGYKNSNYLVLPFFGPSTVRDAIAMPINYEYLTVYPYIYPVSVRYTIYGVGVVDRRADLLQFQNVMEQAALDKYVFLRDAYFQHRKYQIERNNQLGDPYLQKNNKTLENEEETQD